jgi:hypothetical protein
MTSLAPAIDPAEVGIFCSDPAFLDEAYRSVSVNPGTLSCQSSFPFGKTLPMDSVGPVCEGVFLLFRHLAFCC